MANVNVRFVPRANILIPSATFNRSYGFRDGVINKFAFGELNLKGKVEQRAMTTRKRQSNDKARSARHAEPNLGQQAADREKKSKAQLSRMRGRNASSAPGRFVAWCKQEQASVQQQLEMMLAGKVPTGENHGSDRVDTTGNSIKRAKARLAELESLLTEKGSATISNP